MDIWLAERFEQHRDRLRAVAHRMLGSPSEAEDAVQEAWLRLSRTGDEAIDNLGGWLTTVVGRVCLDMLRSRASRREQPLEDDERHIDVDDAEDPEEQVMLADAVGPALLAVLDTLTPRERLAFVLHDLFEVPFEEIAPIVERSPAAARQLASRARRRIRGASATGELDRARQRAVVDAFLAASRSGNFEALLALLDPDVVLRADATAVRMGAAREVQGAAAVAETLAGRARAARPALVDGAVGLVWSVRGAPRVAFAFTIAEERVSAIELIADPARLAALDLSPMEREPAPPTSA